MLTSPAQLLRLLYLAAVQLLSTCLFGLQQQGPAMESSLLPNPFNAALPALPDSSLLPVQGCSLQNVTTVPAEGLLWLHAIADGSQLWPLGAS